MLLPLSDKETIDLFIQIGDPIHATVYGTLYISFEQGFWGGFRFARATFLGIGDGFVGLYSNAS